MDIYNALYNLHYSIDIIFLLSQDPDLLFHLNPLQHLLLFILKCHVG